MKYLSIKDVASKWNIDPRRVQVLCKEGRINGAKKISNAWIIPSDAEKPYDARKKVHPKCSFASNSDIIIDRVWAMPNKNTFDIKPIKELILEEKTGGLWIDPFANSNKLAEITNDLNITFDTDYHLDALDFMHLFENTSVDGVLYDPPYSPRQVSECYNNVGINVTWDTTKASFWGNHKRELSRIVKVGGKVITFGWNSGGIGKKYGFEILRILLVPHGGWHNDTICTVEIKRQNAELDNIKENVVNKTSNISKTDTALIEEFQKLPADYWDFKNADTKEYTHGIHNYPAMMVAPISRNIIRIVSTYKKINALYDPFAGSGTVLVEGMLSNIPKITGTDINPLALFISTAKVSKLDIYELENIQKELFLELEQEYLEMQIFIDSIDSIIMEKSLDLTAKDGWGTKAPEILKSICTEKEFNIQIPNFKNIGYWFKPRIIIELSIIKKHIDRIENIKIKNFFYVAFSETIRLVSNRRNGEFKMFRMTAEKVKMHTPSVRLEFSKILNRNIEKMFSFLQVIDENNISSEVSIIENNVCLLDKVEDDTYDLIITSPPYGDSRTTVAYGEYCRLSLQWLGINNLSDNEIMGIDKSLMGGNKYRNGFEYDLSSGVLKKILQSISQVDIIRAGDVYSFYKDLEAAIKQTSKKTKTEGYHFWVVGNRTVKGFNLPTDQIIAEMATKYGLVHIHTINRNIPNKVMPSQNSPTNETGVKSATMINEHIVVLRKE